MVPYNSVSEEFLPTSPIVEWTPAEVFPVGSNMGYFKKGVSELVSLLLAKHQAKFNAPSVAGVRRP